MDRAQLADLLLFFVHGGFAALGLLVALPLLLSCHGLRSSLSYGFILIFTCLVPYPFVWWYLSSGDIHLSDGYIALPFLPQLYTLRSTIVATLIYLAVWGVQKYRRRRKRTKA